MITPIDFDHEEWLGKTIPEIAAEKAGIIKPGVPVVSAPQRAEAEEVIRARAAKCGAPLQFVTRPYDKTPIALAGSHQKQNAALAVAALRATKIDADDSAIARGLAAIDWPARFQRWDERTIVDGAHNPRRVLRSQKHGAKILAISAPRSCLRSFLTKTCAVSVKRLRRLASWCSCQKFAASAQLIQKSLARILITSISGYFVGQALRLPATPKPFFVALQSPSLNPLMTR